MLEKLAISLKELGLTKNDRLLVAFSSGLDSTVLSHALIALGYPLSLVHVNFQLRGEASEGDAKFCENFALKQQVPFYLCRCDTKKFAQERKLSIQEAARELRYSYFEELQTEHKFSAVLTAHHADDNLETFLINFTRSGGLKGLKGIPQKRGFYLRPLLGLTRKELENYAKSHKISWREDASNLSEKYQRNKYRLKLIPQWKEIETDLLTKANRSLALLREQSFAFEALLQEMLAAHLNLTGTIETLNTKHLRSKAYWPSLLRFWLEEKGPWDYPSLEKLWQSENSKSLESENFIIYHQEGQYFLSPKKEISDLESYQISLETKSSANLEFQKLALKNYPEVPSSQDALLDFDKLSFPLLLRPWQAGDRFKPLGLSGSKKVSDYLNDIKISGSAKQEQYVLCSGDDIVWLVGNRIDHRYRVTNSTKTIYFVRTL